MIKCGMNEAHVGSPHRGASRGYNKVTATPTGSLSGPEKIKILGQIDQLAKDLAQAKSKLESGATAGEVMGYLKYFSSDADKVYQALGKIASGR